MIEEALLYVVFIPVLFIPIIMLLINLEMMKGMEDTMKKYYKGKPPSHKIDHFMIFVGITGFLTLVVVFTLRAIIITFGV